MKYEQIKAGAVLAALQEAGGSMSKACALLGVSRSSVYRIAKRHRIVWHKKGAQDSLEEGLAVLGVQSHQDGLPRPTNHVYDDARAHAWAICNLHGGSVAAQALRALCKVREQLCASCC